MQKKIVELVLAVVNSTTQSTTSTTPKDGDIISWGNGITSEMKDEYKLVLQNGSDRFEEICGVGAKM
jgi:hypothetical protein